MTPQLLNRTLISHEWSIFYWKCSPTSLNVVFLPGCLGSCFSRRPRFETWSPILRGCRSWTSRSSNSPRTRRSGSSVLANRSQRRWWDWTSPSCPRSLPILASASTTSSRTSTTWTSASQKASRQLSTESSSIWSGMFLTRRPRLKSPNSVWSQIVPKYFPGKMQEFSQMSPRSNFKVYVKCCCCTFRRDTKLVDGCYFGSRDKCLSCFRSRFISVFFYL